MATLEGTRSSIEFICVNVLPDVCLSPSVPVPYKILSLFDCAVDFSTDVRFRQQFAFHHDSRLSTVRCNEPGVGGGVFSGVNMGWCRPVPGTHSTTVRVNGSFVDYHAKTYMYMNCAGPEGPPNTIGIVLFLGNMLPGPVGPPGKIGKSSFCGTPGLLSDFKDLLDDAEKLIEVGKKLYELAKTDWSDPSSVLGAIGGVAGLAGLQDIADTAAEIKELYDLGKKIADTDWSDPKSVLSTVAGAANVAGMKDLAKAADMAKKVANVLSTDWSDPKAATAAVIEILKSTGMDKMLVAMASNAVSSSKTPVPIAGTPFFPSGTKPSDSPAIPPSPSGRPRRPLTADLLNHLKKSNPVAYARFEMLSKDEKKRAFAEIGPDDGNTPEKDRIAFYLPGEGFTTSQQERDGMLPVSDYTPDLIKEGFNEIFVADKKDATEGNFFGIKQKEGNVYLFGGLIDLGSPEMPGAGNATTWWIPDRILNMDMTPYYDYHDKHYYGGDVTLSDLGEILQHEIDSFKAGLTTNPLQLPLQAIYSAATTGVGIFTAAKNSLFGAGQGTFDSLSDFYDSVFGTPTSVAQSGSALGIMPGGCTGPLSTPAGGGTASGAGGGPSGTGGPPSPPAPSGAASGAGTDGILITIAPGNPAAAAADIEAQFRADNAKAKSKAEAKAKAEAEARANAENQAREKAAAEAKAEAEAEAKAKAEAERKRKEELEKERSAVAAEVAEQEETVESMEKTLEQMKGDLKRATERLLLASSPRRMIDIASPNTDYGQIIHGGHVYQDYAERMAGGKFAYELQRKNRIEVDYEAGKEILENEKNKLKELRDKLNGLGR